LRQRRFAIHTHYTRKNERSRRKRQGAELCVPPLAYRLDPAG
jgi:hypothetical protein